MDKGPRGAPSSQPLRRRHEYSSSGSESNSGSSSSSEGQHARDVTKPLQTTSLVPLPGAHKKELLQFKRRERELASKVSLLEEDVVRERTAKETLEAKTEFLGTRYKAVAERSKRRGNMLAALVRALKSAQEAKERLVEAEAKLQQVSEAAIMMIQEEDRKDKDGVLDQESRPKPDLDMVASQEALELDERPDDSRFVVASDRLDARQATTTVQEGVPGGWTESAYADGPPPDSANPSKFPALKFKINLQ